MKRKCLLAAGIMILLMAAGGCGNGREAGDNSIPVAAEENADGNAGQQGKSGDGESDAPLTSESGNEGDGMADNPATGIQEGDMPGDSALEEGGEGKNPSQDASMDGSIENAKETMIIGGKVREIMEDSFVLSRVQYADDDSSMVLIPEEGSPEEELVTIRCTDETVFEHWLIQGGGAGIDMSKASFADIQKGGGLEAEGHFDGEEFVASKVIIETYE